MTIWTRALTTIAFVGVALSARAAEPLKEGAKAPDVKMKAVGLKTIGLEDGKEFTIKDVNVKGKNVVTI